MNSVHDIAQAISEQSGVRIVCIDGPAGAGKTTLSEQLTELFPTALVIHMDELYDGWNNALDSRLTVRLNDWIVKPLMAGDAITICRYNWHTMSFGEMEQLPYENLVIIEGVGAAQEIMREIATVTVWVDIDNETGKTRVLNRDGDSVAPFIDQWQQDEKRHHEEHATKASCHFVVTTS